MSSWIGRWIDGNYTIVKDAGAPDERPGGDVTTFYGVQPDPLEVVEFIKALQTEP